MPEPACGQTTVVLLMRPFHSRSWLPYAALLLMAVVAVAFFAKEGSFDRKDLAAGLFALFGTFMGALLAFRLEEAKEQAKEVRRQKCALNRALIVLGYQQNSVRQYEQLIAPFKNDVELAFNFPALEPPENSLISQNMDDLDFLLDSSHPNVMFELLIEQDRFDQAMQMIRVRNAFYVNQVQPIFAQRIGNGRIVSSIQLEETLGEYLYGGAIQGAESIRDHIHGSKESIPAMAEKLRKAAKELYPNGKFVRFDNLPPST